MARWTTALSLILVVGCYKQQEPEDAWVGLPPAGGGDASSEGEESDEAPSARTTSATSKKEVDEKSVARQEPAKPTEPTRVPATDLPPMPDPSVATGPHVTGEPVTGEGYTDYGVNGFELTEQDRLSTFSIDVDTASYTLVRRKLREGYLPPHAAVRVEEFVNYFPYEYRQPAPGDPFAVDFEASASPWNPRHEIVRIGVQGKKVARDQRKPVDLTFLVDVSGSMQGEDRIGLVKRSLKMLTEELGDGDTVAIAVYAGSSGVVLEPTPMTEKAKILKALDRLTAGGSTAMGAGIDAAYALADQAYDPGAVNHVIICSDGDANVGQTSPDALLAKIQGYADKGITLTTTGFGSGNYKDTMMERLANEGEGNYYYVDSDIEARRIFVDRLGSTIETIATDVKIQVDWNPDAVYAYRLIGYENRDIADRDFRNDAVDAGEIGSGHQVTALYEVVLREEPGDHLATVRIRNEAPGPESPAVERAYDLRADSIKETFAETSDEFRIAVAAGTFAEILRASPHVAEVSLSEVAAVARSAKRPEYREDAELVELVERAAQLRGEGTAAAR